MTTIEKVFDAEKSYEKALLAKLAYEKANMTYVEEMNNKNKDENNDTKIKFFDQFDGKLTKEEIEYLNNNFIYLDGVYKGMDNGFEACWVERKDINGFGTGEITYAIAGITPPFGATPWDIDDDGDDEIHSGKGITTAFGGSGSDKYFYTKDSGHLIIQENSFDKTDFDTIKFDEISKTDTRNYLDLCA